MRRYIMKEKKETETIICNGCGKEICVTDGIPKEDMLSVEKRWGYFSGKDNEVHRFDLCEDCYDRLIAQFVIAPETENGNRQTRIEPALCFQQVESSTVRVDMEKKMNERQLGERTCWMFVC